MRKGENENGRKKESDQEIDTEAYAAEFSEPGLWDKIRDNVASIGLNLIYKALQLFYVAQSPDCPMKVKAGIYGALGYFISPVDLIPDFTPVVGYSDDASAIGLALLLAQMYVTEEVKAKARSKMQEIFGETALEKLSEG
ncbi:MAG: YkvA family protein [Schwartzia sp. (in: firmicutes)]